MHRLTGFGLLILGIGIATAALLGPLAFGLIQFRITPEMENQMLGGDAVSLLLVAPVAIVAGLLWLRDHRLAPAMALGASLYAVYTYPQYVLVPDYTRYAGNNERFFPLFFGLILLGWIIAARAWRALDEQHVPALPPGFRRALASIFLVISGLFTLAWGQQLAVVMIGGIPTPDYQAHATAFWLIKLLDVTIVIPVALATGIGLLRGAPAALKAAYALASLYTCLGASVAAMAVVMQARHDPSASPLLLMALLPLVAGMLAATVRLFRAAGQAPGPRPSLPTSR